MNKVEFDDHVERVSELLVPEVGDEKYLAIVEGTGWPTALDGVFNESAKFSYGESDTYNDQSALALPGVSSGGGVAGHKKRLAIGDIDGRGVLRLGRMHPYEGAPFAVRVVMAALRDRIDGVIVTNGVGSFAGRCYKFRRFCKRRNGA
ncbi:hypothetical protein COU74_03910 [Candidatus Peregrinibacteria bacterium CG10_big_fil_rev_8_21_14_0_10_36_19]|nr:MAG: hypothetical protein COU74_03910 [Candidatus Peregrinibacteria bacterium CG10_big_fil_rev_8_21_14_0_10_36_19]